MWKKKFLSPIAPRNPPYLFFCRQTKPANFFGKRDAVDAIRDGKVLGTHQGPILLVDVVVRVTFVRPSVHSSSSDFFHRMTHISIPSLCSRLAQHFQEVQKVCNKVPQCTTMYLLKPRITARDSANVSASWRNARWYGFGGKFAGRVFFFSLESDLFWQCTYWYLVHGKMSVPECSVVEIV